MIVVDDLYLTYAAADGEPVTALCGVSLSLVPGEFVALVGQNGSGKSTLARCLNGLLVPTAGRVVVDGRDTRQAADLVGVRERVGMVFQNPENQIISTVVEEEVAFGPENLGVPHPELRRRVDNALQQVGLWDERHRNPSTLSAGERARLAVAGVLAMRPRYLILDETTALLDPVSRRELLELIARLHAGGLAILLITHSMAEAALAQRLVVLAHGRIVLQGAPREAFAQAERMEALGLGLPPAAAVARGLRRRGLALPEGLLSARQLAAALQAARAARA